MVSLATTELRRRLSLRSEDIPVAAIYRASLAQLETKIRLIRRTTSIVNDFSYFQCERTSKIDFDTAHIIRDGHSYNLSQIALIIDSVGKVEINNKSFIPGFSGVSDPLNVRLGTLREYCERMSDLGTDPSERIEGYNLNSIPSAKWERRDEDDEKSIRLTNPDEIIPSDHDYAYAGSVLDDVRVTDDFCRYQLSRTPEFRATVNYEEYGDPGMLVSTHVIPGQSLKLDNDVITGVQKEFWCPERIPRASWSVGVLGLVGETLNPMDGSSRSNAVAMRSIVDWRQISGMTV